jgi:hypothetical protein
MIFGIMQMQWRVAFVPSDATQDLASRMLAIFAATAEYAVANPGVTGNPPATAFSAAGTAPDAVITARIDAGPVINVFTGPTSDAAQTAVNLQRLTNNTAFAGLVQNGVINGPPGIGTVAVTGITNGSAAIWGPAL